MVFPVNKFKKAKLGISSHSDRSLTDDLKGLVKSRKRDIIKIIGTFLVIRWLRLHTPNAGDQLQSLVRELDLICHNRVCMPLGQINIFWKMLDDVIVERMAFLKKLNINYVVWSSQKSGDSACRFLPFSHVSSILCSNSFLFQLLLL